MYLFDFLREYASNAELEKKQGSAPCAFAPSRKKVWNHPLTPFPGMQEKFCRNFHWVNPGFAGGPQQFDDSGKIKKPPNSWTAQSHEKGGFMNDVQCLSHTKWECKFRPPDLDTFCVAQGLSCNVLKLCVMGVDTSRLSKGDLRLQRIPIC
jgi:hypothetical protein